MHQDDSNVLLSTAAYSTTVGWFLVDCLSHSQVRRLHALSLLR
jgi:hypothetical protein